MKTTRLILAFSLGALPLLSACAGGADSPNIRSFAVSDDSIPEGGVDVTFTWNVKNASTLELLPYPGAVTGTSATVNVAESTTFKLVAKKDGRADRKSLDIVVGAAFDVTGHLVSDAGAPSAGITVAIGDRVTVSDANGMFNFENVVPPYDLAVIRAGIVFAPGGTYVQLFQGVTRPDPTVTVNAFVPAGTGRSATIQGTVSGGLGFPNAGDTVLFYTLEDELSGTYPVDDAGDGSYSFVANWADSDPSANVAVNAVQRDGADNFSHARLTGALADMGVLALDPALVDVPETTHTAQISNPWGGSNYGSARFGFREFNLDSDPPLLVTSVLTTAGLFTAKTPSVPSSFSHVALGAEDASGVSEVLLIDDQGGELLEFVLPPPVRLLSPVEGASVAALTPFAISSQSGRINVFTFFPGFLVGGPSYSAYVEVYTTDTTVTFPDLAAIGLPIPSGTYLNWSASAFGPFASLDDALGQARGHLVPQAGLNYREQSYVPRSFVTEGVNPGGDDDDVVFSSADVRYEPVPEN